MGYIFAVDEAIEKLITSLSEAIGWKYLKSQRCLKKTVGDLVFEIDFYCKYLLSLFSIRRRKE